MAKIEFTFEELHMIRRSIGAEIDIMEDELDNEKNKQNLELLRGKMLREEDTLIKILSKVQRALKETPTYTRAFKHQHEGS